MEKYRRFGDAATGIQPFVCKIGIGAGGGVVTVASGGIGSFQASSAAPHFIITALAAIVFPVRMALLALLGLVLLVVDLLAQWCRVLGIRWLVGEVLLYPLIVLVARVWLVVAGAVTIRRRLFPIRLAAGAARTEAVLPPAAGDVVFSNLVTPLDHFILTAAGSPVPALAASADQRWRMSSCLVAFISHKEPRLVTFGPNPWQRWQVLRHIMHATTATYLAPGKDEAEGPAFVDLTFIQKRAKKTGVPVLVFTEGTPTNGQGVLAAPPVVTDPRFKNHVVSLCFDAPVLSRIIESSPEAMAGAAPFVGAGSSGYLSYFFNLSRRGSGTAATTNANSFAASLDGLFGGVLSPLLTPLFSGYRNVCRVSVVRPSQVPTPTIALTPEVVAEQPAVAAQVARQWSEDVRGKLCASVSYGNPNVVCKPLSVGVAEKRALQQYVANEMEAAKIPDAAPTASSPSRPRPVPAPRKIR